MTKLEILLSYTPAQRRDTWIVQGQQIVDQWTKTFVKDTIFRVQTPNVPLSGCVLFCTKTFTDINFDWAQWSIQDLNKGTIVNTDYITHPNLYVLLTQQQFTDLNQVDFNTNWIPFQEAELKDDLEISDDDLNWILANIGVPFININELEFSREDIIKYAILPAVNEYFKWYPIVEVGSYYVSNSTFSIPMPEGAIGVLRAYILPITGFAGSSINNPFFTQQMISFSGTTSIGKGVINPRSARNRKFLSADHFLANLTERAFYRSLSNVGTKIRVRTKLKEKVVQGYSTFVPSVLEIEWAFNSKKWDDIPYNRRSEVKQLAEAYVLRMLGSLRNQYSGDVAKIDYNFFLTRATELENAVITLWQNSIKPVAIRSSV